MIQVENIARAAHTIDPVFTHTPQYRSEGLSAKLGLNVIHKVESTNPIGSFKGRGVDWWFSQYTDHTHVVCASAGNFGQAVAYVGRKHGVKVEVFASENANPAKVEAMRRLGATVTQTGNDFDEAKQAAAAYADEKGLFYLLDGLVPEIGEGAGTMMVELADYPTPIDKFYVPVGNGSLINGVGAWAKAHVPHTKIIGVVAEAAPSMMMSWKEGKVVNTQSADTIADGIAVRLPIPESLGPLAHAVDDMISVSEDEIIAAMKIMFRDEKLVVETSGAVSLAAILKNAKQDAGCTVANLVCGGNIDADGLEKYLCA